MNLRTRLGLLPLLATALTACSLHVEGNGVYAERVFDAGRLAPFDGAAIGFEDVDAHGEPPTATVFLGVEPRRVVLSGDENVIEHIQVVVDAAGVLRTTTDLHGYRAVHPPQLLVQAPALASVEVLGGAVVTVHDAAAGSFSVTAVDRGHVTLAGAGGAALVVTLSGGSQLDASAYPVTSAQLALDGASSATVWPVEPASGSAAGGSAVFVKGLAGCEVALSGGATCGPAQ